MRLGLGALLGFSAAAIAVVAVGCGEVTVQQDPGGGPTGCTPLTCEMACEHGFEQDANGCAICECKEPPDCEPVDCDLYCEFGYATDDEGCPTCACLPGACPTPSPAGCVMNGCPPDSVCDTSQGCTSSNCFCDEDSGQWSCTDDCGGGICVTVGACEGSNPQGCVNGGCDPGEVCDTTLGCVSSSCTCDAASGSWACTNDCGGGVCVPDPAGCNAPNPAGCVSTGCAIGFECVQASGVCVPSTCMCEASTGMWSCTDDCGGGICIDGA